VQQELIFLGSDAAATGADALAAALGAETCDMTGMDDKVRNTNSTWKIMQEIENLKKN